MASSRELPKSVGSWRDPCSTGQNCELMDPSSDLIALWKNNSSKSSSTGQFDWPIQLANGYRDPHLLPTAMIRYMVVVLARPIFCGVLARPILADIESGTRENEVITPWSQIPNLIQLVQGTEQALPLYDPVHGSGPGEIVFLAVLPTAMIRYLVVVLGRWSSAT